MQADHETTDDCGAAAAHHALAKKAWAELLEFTSLMIDVL